MAKTDGMVGQTGVELGTCPWNSPGYPPAAQNACHHVQQHFIFVRHVFTPLMLMTLSHAFLRFLAKIGARLNASPAEYARPTGRPDKVHR
ncbi:MAG: hypothetical protein VB959_19175 [Rhodospirillales bacterium]